MNTTLANKGGLALRLPRPGLIIKKTKDRLQKKAVLPQDFFEDVLKNFNLVIQSPVEVLAGAFRSDTWLLKTNQGKKVLKRYKANLTHEQIVHEHSILNHLEKVNFPAPRLVPDLSASTIIEHDSRFYTLYDFLDGYYKYSNYFFLPNRNSWFLKSMGKTLGALHSALYDFIPEGHNVSGFQSTTGERFLELSWFLDKLEMSKQQTGSRRADPEWPALNLLLQKADWMTRQLTELDTQLKNFPLHRQVIHGDFGPYNLMYHNEKGIAPIDFELARLDWQLMDLVAAFSTNTSSQKNKHSLPIMRLIAQGYQSVNPVAKPEWLMLPQVWQFTVLRRIAVCWAQYLEQGSKERLNETQRRLGTLDWISQSKPALEALID